MTDGFTYSLAEAFIWMHVCQSAQPARPFSSEPRSNKWELPTEGLARKLKNTWNKDAMHVQAISLVVYRNVETNERCRWQSAISPAEKTAATKERNARNDRRNLLAQSSEPQKVWKGWFCDSWQADWSSWSSYQSGDDSNNDKHKLSSNEFCFAFPECSGR